MVHARHGDADRAEMIARRRARVMELRADGKTFREIAKELGVSLGLVHSDFEEVCRQLPARSVDQYRDEQIARMKKMRAVIQDILDRRHVHVSASGRIVLDMDGEPVEDDAIVVTAVNQLVKIDEAERKLLGLDAKAEVSITGDLAYHIIGASLGLDDDAPAG